MTLKLRPSVHTHFGPWPNSAKAALLCGAKSYFTGRPCKHGHIELRRATRRMCSECDREFDVRYRQESPERKSASFQSWKAENMEKIRANDRRRRNRDPERHRQKSRDRRALEHRADGSHTSTDIEWLLSAQKYKCAYCKTSVRKARHVDHVVPLSKGGRNDKGNLQILCPDCNLRKQAQDPIVFANKIGLLL